MRNIVREPLCVLNFKVLYRKRLAAVKAHVLEFTWNGKHCFLMSPFDRFPARNGERNRHISGRRNDTNKCGSSHARMAL